MNFIDTNHQFKNNSQEFQMPNSEDLVMENWEEREEDRSISDGNTLDELEEDLDDEGNEDLHE